ncbi:alpha/beta hydrolase [Mesorhizobium xinjiangense]|uniref:alpha/beta hydrolase n=1 Tax=Mesorhizobium xinjiangense TaxID=2678685 RepID=UPI0012EE5A09|nr:alpha/beta hydrolase [Mesorhizobium xinjiangense]
MASFPLTVIRGAFGIADHLIPRLAGRAAFELFCRTRNPNRPPDRERQVIERAVPFMAEARHHRLTARSGCVAVHEFRPPHGVASTFQVLVIHGWNSRTEHMAPLIETMRARGGRVFALDLPGHGWSSGRRLNLATGVDATATAAQWFGPFDAIVGHSFGGAVAVNAVVGAIKGVMPVEAARLALIAAPNSMPSFFDGFGRMLNLGPRAQTALAGEVARIAGRPLSEFVGADQLSRCAIPTLVVHAPDDKEVPAAHAEAYGQAGPHIRLVWAHGLGHRRIIAGPGVLTTIADFAAPTKPVQPVHGRMRRADAA